MNIDKSAKLKKKKLGLQVCKFFSQPDMSRYFFYDVEMANIYMSRCGIVMYAEIN